MRDLIIAAVLFVLIGTTAIMTFQANSDLAPILEGAREKTTPLDLDVVRITADGCEQCAPADLSGLTDINATLNEQSLDRVSALDLIEQYSIERLPATVIRGTTDRLTIPGFELADDGALVRRDVPAPYVDTASGAVMGIVSYASFNGSCEACIDLAPLITSLGQAGVVFEEAAFAEPSRVPSLVFDSGIEAYPEVFTQLRQQGLVASDDGYVLFAPAPYMEDGVLRGVVNLITIDDPDCDTCYAPEVHEAILPSYGLFVDSVTRYNVSDPMARELIDQYAIEDIPTAIITGDVSIYESFTAAWLQVGTVEDDGSYVFRSTDILGNSTKV